MSEIRYDPIRKAWMVISAHRGLRPDQLQRCRPPDLPEGTRSCPFCPGNEGMTPPQIMALGDEGKAAGESEWRIRVFPNKYPAFEQEIPFGITQKGLYQVAPGVGVQEIIVETPDHQSQMADLPDERVREILWVFRERLRYLKNHGGYRTVSIFKNHGRDAGASLKHTHSQIIGVPIVPDSVMSELEGFRDWQLMASRCLMCAMIDQERVEGERVILDRAGVLAFAPFASGFPFQIRVVHSNHNSDFSAAADEDLAAVAPILREVLIRLRKSLDDPPFNMVLNTVPFSDPGEGEDLGDTATYYHWYIDIVPRLIRIAGFEWRTGMIINHTSPEKAAEVFRDTAI